MFTFRIMNNGREVENLDAGQFPTEAGALAAGRAAMDDLCPPASSSRRFYRVEAIPGEPDYQWWRFGGANLQAVYGNGTRAQAEAYALHLNRGRDVNLYMAEALGDDDARASELGGCLDIANEGVNLDAELSAIGEE